MKYKFYCNEKTECLFRDSEIKSQLKQLMILQITGTCSKVRNGRTLMSAKKTSEV